MRIAFLQLASFGDCINSTMMLKPIIDHYRGHRQAAHIEVHTSTYYQAAFRGNPYVDKVVAHPAGSKTQAFDLYGRLITELNAGGWDKVFVPAPVLHADRSSRLHPEFGQNIICTFMRVLEDAGIAYDWPVQTVLRLEPGEVANVGGWLGANHVTLAGRRNILMEVHGESGQTFWDKHWTLAVGRYLAGGRGTNLFISNRHLTQEIAQLEAEYRGGPSLVRWVGALSLRECAELFNRCDRFFSVSSGLANTVNTDYCRRDVAWVEVVNNATVTTAPVRSAGRTYWHVNDIAKFIEMLKTSGV